MNAVYVHGMKREALWRASFITSQHPYSIIGDYQSGWADYGSGQQLVRFRSEVTEWVDYGDPLDQDDEDDERVGKALSSSLAAM